MRSGGLAIWRLLPIGLVAAVCTLPAAGCGGDSTETVTVERHVTIEQQVPPHRKKHRRKSHPAPTPAFVSCDANIQAEAGTTTCPFAENVFWTYWTSRESTGPLLVWSPAARASFDTTCNSDGAQVVCTTPDNAEVRFSQAALDRYSQAQADAYASGHDLGPDPYEGLPPSGSSVGDNCQGYDPCISPGSDVDCAGGSGNGPRYIDGPVYVTGADPYGLDSNGDGVGCEL
jgi:hypothetical protein